MAARLLHKTTRGGFIACPSCGIDVGGYLRLVVVTDRDEWIGVCPRCAGAGPDALAERLLVRAAELAEEAKFYRELAHELRDNPPVRWPTRKQIRKAESRAAAELAGQATESLAEAVAAERGPDPGDDEDDLDTWPNGPDDETGPRTNADAAG